LEATPTETENKRVASTPHTRRKRSSVERPLTCQEAADLVRVHAKTVKRMARMGELPGHFASAVGSSMHLNWTAGCEQRYIHRVTRAAKTEKGGSLHVQADAIKPLLVEEWLMSLVLAPKSRGHVRSIMHILFNWPMKWEYIEMLDYLSEPIRRMCIVSACLGLRASELVGLQWGDFDWKNREVHIQRGVVIG
jgi:excisionase family DNA binding protein